MKRLMLTFLLLLLSASCWAAPPGFTKRATCCHCKEVVAYKPESGGKIAKCYNCHGFIRLPDSVKRYVRPIQQFIQRCGSS